jgi:hypothetical protein
MGAAWVTSLSSYVLLISLLLLTEFISALRTCVTYFMSVWLQANSFCIAREAETNSTATALLFNLQLYYFHLSSQNKHGTEGIPYNGATQNKFKHFGVITKRPYTYILFTPVKYCEISGYHGGELKMTAFWDIAPCNVVEIDRHFRGAYCLHHHPDHGGSTYLWNVGLL